MLYAIEDTTPQEVLDRRKIIVKKTNKLDEIAKEHFKSLGFKVIKNRWGFKACKQDVDLTFYFEITVNNACWSYAEERGEYRVFAKIPYTDIEVADFFIRLNTVETDAEEEAKLRRLFADDDFNKLIKWKLPRINKKFI